MSHITDINDYRRRRNGSPTRARIASVRDVKNPNVWCHVVIHELRDVVEDTVAELIRDIDERGGQGDFSIGRQGGLYVAVAITKRFS